VTLCFVVVSGPKNVIEQYGPLVVSSKLRIVGYKVK